jgi:sulfide dehydrogenase [flavocytochrome c] flavoprotein subunit
MSSSRRAFLKALTALSAGFFSPRVGATRSRTQNRARIVVVGGGYGGATAAKYLKIIDPNLQVTLVHREPRYVSCPGSNEVLAELRSAGWLQRVYDALARRHGVRLVRGEVSHIDTERSVVVLRDQTRLSFERAVVSPGIAFRWDTLHGYDEDASAVVPHAWQGGPQIEVLRKQVRAMRKGGTVVIVAPPNPYRCPPGPYERASLLAHFLKRHNPTAKILILDPKTQFSKQALFQKGWADLYPGLIDWIPSSKEGAIERVEAIPRVVHTEFGEHRADVLNVIPAQKAGALAEIVGLTDDTGWCPVDPRSFVSLHIPTVHVIGDACIAAPMPKSAFAANSQAKTCAAAIVELINGRPPGLPSLINHCYSFLAPNYAISVTGVYEYSEQDRGLVATSSGETPMVANRALEARYAKAWQRNFARDVFG